MNCGVASQCASCKEEFSSLCDAHYHISKGRNHHGFLYSVHLSKNDKLVVYPCKDICSTLYRDLQESNKPQDCLENVKKSTDQAFSGTHSKMKVKPSISLEKKQEGINSFKKNKTSCSNRCTNSNKLNKYLFSRKQAVVSKLRKNEMSSGIQIDKSDKSDKPEVMSFDVIDGNTTKSEPFTKQFAQCITTKCQNKLELTEKVVYLETTGKNTEKSLEEIAIACTEAIDKSVKMLKPEVIIVPQGQVFESKSGHASTFVKDFVTSDKDVSVFNSNQVSTKKYCRWYNTMDKTNEKQFLKNSNSVHLVSKMRTPSPVRIAKKPTVLTLKQGLGNRTEYIALCPSIGQKNIGNCLKSSSHSPHESKKHRFVDKEIVTPVLLVNNKHYRDEIDKDIVRNEQFEENQIDIEGKFIDRNIDVSNELVIVKREVEDDCNNSMAD